MPRFTRIIPDLLSEGPTLPIKIEPVLAVQQILRDNGETIPSASVVALLDTGASGTLVRTSVLTGLGFEPAGQVFLKTPSTQQPLVRFQYRIRVTLSEHVGFDLDVVEGPLAGQHVQCLIGRDILQHAILTYNGPKNSYTLNIRSIEDG